MKVFQGTLVHATEESPMQILPNHVIGIENGKIVFVSNADDSEEIRDRFGYELDQVTVLGQHEFLMPGLVDTHIHAPQYVYAGTSLDLPLLKWLEKYTFPTEAKFADIEFAEHAYNKVVQRTLRNGTTTACYFATIHLNSTLRLCDIIEHQGQRGYVGKVNMDRNSPSFYIEETSQSLRDTQTFIENIQSRNNPLLTPVVTPRFAPSTTEQLMTGLGELAEKYNIPIQSHISETRPECAWIADLHPQCQNYTDVYDKHKLLTEKTVMAHGVYLSDSELEVFKERGAGVSHCPNSNLSLRSGHMDARNLLTKKVKVGLGTDVSGGYSPSMFDSVRQCVQVSNTHSILQDCDTYKAVNVSEAFRMATLGSSQVLGLEDRIGNFVVGKDFDALRINPDSDGSPFDVFDQDSLDDIIHKCIFLGDDRNIADVYVAGRQVHPNVAHVNGYK